MRQYWISLNVGTVITLAAILATSCGKDNPQVFVAGPTGAPGQVVYVPAPAPATPEAQVEINEVVSDENQYREGLGQTLISNGLSCSLYTITGGQYIQNIAPTLTAVTLVATFLHKDVFNQPDSPSSDGLNVLPPALKANPRYLNLIKLTCTGQLVVTNTAFYSFELASDDASLLYLDGAMLINNDGSHGVNTVTGTKYLRRGVHAFRLDFAQTGAGNQALILKANSDLIQGAYLYH